MEAVILRDMIERMKKWNGKVAPILAALIIAVGIFASVIYVNYQSRRESDLAQVDRQQEELYKYIARESVWGDFDGNGEWELALAFSKDDYFEKTIDFEGYIAVFNKGGEEIARTPEGFTPVFPGYMEKYQFDENDKRVLLKLMNQTGTHHFKYLFLGLFDDKLLPVCKKEVPQSAEDCEFYNTRGELGIEDLNNDGFVEVIEFVDEYPPEGGRGREVVWAIHSFNGKYFEPQSGEAYDQLFEILAKRNPSSIRRSEMSERSVEDVEFIKSFWERGKEYGKEYTP